MMNHFTNTNNPIDFPKSQNSKIIDELFGQALALAVPETCGNLTPAQLHKFKDIFAELIVMELVSEIQVADVGDLKGKVYYLGKVAKHIEKHFGVEQ